MESWSPKLQLLAVLGATRALVARSPHDGWPVESPSDCAAVLDQMMAYLISPGSPPCPEDAGIQYAPTGPLQEIAIANGWQDEYLALASEFDRLEEELRVFQAKDV
jgi:hypothetical protein